MKTKDYYIGNHKLVAGDFIRAKSTYHEYKPMKVVFNSDFGCLCVHDGEPWGCVMIAQLKLSEFEVVKIVKNENE